MTKAKAKELVAELLERNFIPSVKIELPQDYVVSILDAPNPIPVNGLQMVQTALNVTALVKTVEFR